MKKRILSLLLAALMIFTTSIVAFAADEPDERLTVGTDLRVTPESMTVSAAGRASFKFICTIDMTSVREKVEAIKTQYAGTDLQDKLNEMKTTGTFTITIDYPAMLVVDADYTADTKALKGFDSEVSKYYVENSRVETTNPDGSKTLVIEIATKGDGISVAELESDQALADFTLTFDNVTANDFGTATVTGSLSGKTTTTRGGSSTLVAEYTSVPASVTCTVNKRTSTGGGGGGGAVGQKNYSLTFNVGGDTSKYTPVESEGEMVLKTADFKIPQKDGYVFKGWFFDQDGKTPVGETITLNKNLTVYAVFEKYAAASDKLETVDHFAYVSGYPDGTVRPEANITREEAAMMFYRLLTKAYRATVESKTNSFADVAAERWSNDAISTLVNAGILKGYPDGDFRPGDKITRAEFATLVVNFSGVDAAATHSFTDIKGHWAEQYIATAVKNGWLAGYDDGSFNPNGYITRAEAMTLVNRILYRFVNSDGQHTDAVKWPDNAQSAWYYYAVQEATNGHDYDRQSDGVYENWTDLRK